MSNNILYNSHSKNKLISGAFVLILSNLLTKIIGVVFKIPLYNVLNDIGMSYFNTSYNIFITLYVIIVTGLPVASSMMISNARTEGRIKTIKKIFNITFFLFFILGTLGFLFLFLLSNHLAFLTGDPKTASSIKFISPAIFFICISCSIRGYFQGHKNMSTTSVSEIIESVGKFVLGYLFAVLSINKGYSIEQSAAFAVLGVVAGEALSMVYMIFVKLFKKTHYENVIDNEELPDTGYIIKLLLIISLPIMLEALTLNLTTAVDTFTIVNILSNSLGVDQASKIFGDYSTCVITLFRIPSAFFVPIATVVIPSLVETRTAKDSIKQKLILNGITKLYLIIAIPMTFGMIILSKPLLAMLFKNSNYELMYPLLIIMCLSIITSGYYTISTAYLQAFEKQTKPVISAFVGVIVKLALNIFLLFIPGIGIFGAPIAFFFSYLTMAGMNYIFVRKYIPEKILLFKNLLKPLIASIISSLITVGSYLLFNYLINNTCGIIVSVVLTIGVYFIVIIKINVFSKDELTKIPKGEIIYNFLEKLHLIRKTDNNIENT